MAGPALVACSHCAKLHTRVPIEAGAIATCVRCGFALYRKSGQSLTSWIALVLGTLVVFAIANGFPIVSLSIKGLMVRATFPDALFITWSQGHYLLAVMTGLFGFWVPLTQVLCLLWALMAIASGRLPRDFSYGMRLLHLSHAWSMVPVLMLGILVAIVKLAGLASVRAEPGIWAFAVLTVLMTALARVSTHRLWRYAEDAALVPVSGAGLRTDGLVGSCPACGCVQNITSAAQPHDCLRCGVKFHFRKPRPISRTWALVVAAGILYIPANVLPVMHIRTLTGASSHTILGGVIELWRIGSWTLAIVVFIASVVVPMTKLFALGVLTMQRRWRGEPVQRQRTRLYELVEFIGQWSMLDVFVVILLSAMADFSGISEVRAGPGAASFGVVVILTMLAAMSFDPRTGWDNHASAGRDTNESGAASIVDCSPAGAARHAAITRNA